MPSLGNKILLHIFFPTVMRRWSMKLLSNFKLYCVLDMGDIRLWLLKVTFNTKISLSCSVTDCWLRSRGARVYIHTKHNLRTVLSRISLTSFFPYLKCYSVETGVRWNTLSPGAYFLFSIVTQYFWIGSFNDVTGWRAENFFMRRKLEQYGWRAHWNEYKPRIRSVYFSCRIA